jgi:ATP-dependent Clp protease ATP-binding subunit ClpC
MFERFTDRARRAIVVAQDEARDLQEVAIRPEHLLLGLLKGDGLARQALTRCGVTYESTRTRVAQSIPTKTEATPMQKLPFQPQSKKVLELSLREALRLGHNYIGTEHLLLGLIRATAGEVSQVVEVDTAQIELRLMELLSAASPGPPRSPGLRQAMDRARQAAGPGPMNTGQVLAAMVADENSQAAKALAVLGVTAESLEGALAGVPAEGTSDAEAEPKPIEIRVGDVTVKVQDPDLFSALKDLTSDQILDALRRAVGPAEPPTASAG